MGSIIGIVLIVSIVLLFPLGVWAGYRWRDRISQQRRAQHKAERFVRGQREALRQAGERRSRHDIPNISGAIKELVEIKEAQEALASGDDAAGALTGSGGNDKLA